MEIWKDIKGYEGHYQVSNLGRVKSLNREMVRIDGRRKVLNEMVKKTYINKDGYEYIRLSVNKKGKTFRVHQLVAFTFLDIKSECVIDHINGIKIDNKVENLRFVTQRTNLEFACNNLNDRGITYNKKTNKYEARVYTGSKANYLGSSNDKEDLRLLISNFKKKITNN